MRNDLTIPEVVLSVLRKEPISMVAGDTVAEATVTLTCPIIKAVETFLEVSAPVRVVVPVDIMFATLSAPVQVMLKILKAGGAFRRAIIPTRFFATTDYQVERPRDRFGEHSPYVLSHYFPFQVVSCTLQGYSRLSHVHSSSSSISPLLKWIGPGRLRYLSVTINCPAP